jgi:alpha-beta hydrolase superfamily lysophospholipase
MSLRSALRRLGHALRSLLVALLLVAVGFYLHYLWAGPTLEPWHRAGLDAEFTAGDYRDGRVTTLAQYVARERELQQQLQDEIRSRVTAHAHRPFERYAAGSRSDPAVWTTNWNMTFVLEPAVAPRGGVLLLHGLTDSPYSLRSLGLALAADGRRVVGLRLPGHGTAPAGLLRFEPEDLRAAVRLAMLDLRRSLGPGLPIAVIGYSNGAALAVDYALDARDDAALPRPSRLVLVSPAIGITRLAALGRIRTGLSDLQGFGRAAWQTVEPEIDPFKYQSFPWHAAGVTQRLTSSLTRRIAQLAEQGPVRGLPPVLAFVSTVDSTVQAGKVADALLGQLAAEGHELVLFDVNRWSLVQSLLVEDPGPLTRRLLERPSRPYALTLVTNESTATPRVEERRVPALGTRSDRRPLEAEWPRSVFSLSHVALPFPPDDPLYGYDAPRVAQHIQLGRLEARGENGVLAVPTWLLTRQRSNPFHGYLVERVRGWLEVPVQTTTAAQEPAAEVAP